MKFIGIPRAEKRHGEKYRTAIGATLLVSLVLVCILGAESFFASTRPLTSTTDEAGATVSQEMLPINTDESLAELPNRSADLSPTPDATVSSASDTVATDASSPDVSTPATSAATTVPSDTTAAPVTETAEAVHYYVTASLSIRTGPGTAFDKTGSYKAGDEVDSVAATSNGWKKLSTGSYVIDDFLSTTPPETAMDATYYAKGDVNVRSGPGTEYAVVKTLKAGDAISVVAKTANGWFRTVKGTYLSADVCTDTPPATPTPAATPTPVATPTPKPTPKPTPVPVGGSVRCKVTFYGPQNGSTTTATGTTCEVGRTVAADWTYFPKNSLISISGISGGATDYVSDGSGYKVEDCGYDIVGLWIDIYVPSEEIANKLGTIYVTVTRLS